MVNNWLITGGCGFIGTSLIKKILKETPHSYIRVLDNLSVGSREDLKEVCNFNEKKIDDIELSNGVNLIVGDILDFETCYKVSRDIDCVVHLAANTGVGISVESPRTDMEVNVIGTFNMLESARLCAVNNFVFASSGAPAGVVKPPIHEELAPHPVSPYGSSKLAGEGYCSSYFHSFSVNTNCLRFGNVYGPRSKHKSSVVAKFIRQVLNGEEFEVYGDGSQTRDFIYIDDLVNAVIMASNFNKGGEIFQIATGQEVTLNELVSLLCKILDETAKCKAKIKFGNKRKGDVLRNFSDTSKANSVLGWKALTELEDGLLLTVKEFIK